MPPYALPLGLHPCVVAPERTESSTSWHYLIRIPRKILISKVLKIIGYLKVCKITGSDHVSPKCVLRLKCD